MHIGSLSTALASFLQARAKKGSWLVRIEDLDPYRTVPGASDAILRTLEKFGLHWDGTVIYQSRRHEAYQAALQLLETQGIVYPCICSRKTLDRFREKSPSTAYPGLCRNKSIGRSKPHALRIRTFADTISFDDRIQGRYEQSLAQEIGDFVLRRRDRAYAYQLAVVIDDYDQQITEVMRGFDLLGSTPRQIFLQRRLRLPMPEYAHLPVIVDESGNKLSKQSRARLVEDDEPSRSIFYLLTQLHQSPPRELKGAPPAELLAWAIAHWNPERLEGIRTIPL